MSWYDPPTTVDHPSEDAGDVFNTDTSKQISPFNTDNAGGWTVIKPPANAVQQNGQVWVTPARANMMPTVIVLGLAFVLLAALLPRKKGTP